MEEKTLADKFGYAIRTFEDALGYSIALAEKLRDTGDQEDRDLAAVIAGGLFAIESIVGAFNDDLLPILQERSDG